MNAVDFIQSHITNTEGTSKLEERIYNSIISSNTKHIRFKDRRY